jgi:hypothetical protein
LGALSAARRQPLVSRLARFAFNTNSTLESGAIGFDITVLPAQASQFSYDANGNKTSYVYDSLNRFT